MKAMNRTKSRYNHGGLNTIANLIAVSGLGLITYSVVQLVVFYIK